MPALYALEAYLLFGFIYAIYFAFWRVDKVDAGAEKAGWKFRLLLIPGSTFLWPYLIFKKNPIIHTRD